MKFPKTIYVSINDEGSPDRYFLADECPEDCMDDNGPRVIASYTLASTDTYEKQCVLIKKSKKLVKERNLLKAKLAKKGSDL